jgi:hypothetical protein
MQKKQARYMKQAKEEYVKAGAYKQKQKKKKKKKKKTPTTFSNKTKKINIVFILI